MSPDDIRLAHALADAAGAAIRPFFRAEFAMEQKGDDSPVTAADRAAEAAMRALIEAERPEDGIFGEEYGVVRGEARRVWVLDPIDGTRAFVTGRPLFGTLIALVEEGVPALGVIDQPILRERWVGARGQPTRFNAMPVSTRHCATLDHAHIGSTAPQAFAEAELHAYGRVAAGARDAIWGGDCYNYGLVALGQLDAVIEANLKLYDFAALVPVVEGAGGVMRDWQGAPLTAASDGRVVAAGDPRLLAPILARLEG
ncbi:histidinol-phosphatase [Sphingomonas morindae]|uniref:Histidinol-phosphatase n=1 Tax=Sphingomonas morindae TaxID=1541170 RepID=A0ABY4X9G3_9SPHN|nr:histidinol-phosphatase [Sphingomonas morindae]USI73356.1 histidinol-phosphatase [Sphingomonas morindae]